MMLVIAFVAAWVIRHAWDEKTDEFRAHNKQVRKDINQRYPNASKDRREQMVRNAARRKAGGWNLYQLRHGWPSLWTAIKDGYAEARRDHQEWVKANPKPEGKGSKKKRFRLAEAARAGWKRATEFTMRKRAARKEEAESKPGPRKAPQPVPPAPQGAKAAAATKTKVIPINQAGSANRPSMGSTKRNNGGTPQMASTGEVGGYAESQALADEYAAALQNTQSVLERYEASLLTGGLGKDPGVIGTLASAREGFDTAQTSFQAHKQGLNTHQQGAEYASSKGDAAAKTEWLGNN